MIKIIKRGALPEEQVYKILCTYCKSELEGTTRDGKVTYDQRDGIYLTIKCTVCTKDVCVDIQQ